MLPDRGPEEEGGGLGQGEGEEEGGEQTAVHSTASWEWPHCTGRRCSNTGVLSIFLPAYHTRWVKIGKLGRTATAR